MEEAPVVEVGAVFRLHEGHTYRCSNVWIDEDGVPHVVLDRLFGSNRPPVKVTYNDLRGVLINEAEFERLNSGHAAYSWRNNQ